jgi:hypothetical protein
MTHLRAGKKLIAELRQGVNICIPSDGLGTGLAELPKRAPSIHALIEERIRELESLSEQAIPQTTRSRPS